MRRGFPAPPDYKIGIITSVQKGTRLGTKILSGILGPVSLADIFSLLNLSKKTGALKCRRGKIEKTIYWEEGEVVFARSNLREDSLGNFLLDRGTITQEQKEESFRKIGSGERHGKVLVRLGYLTPEQLLWGVRHHVQEILYTLFLWEEGLFEFEEGSLKNREKVTLSSSTTRIVMDGIRRLDEWNRIQELIPNMNAVPQKTAKGSAVKEKMGPEVTKLLKMVDGKTTFHSLKQRAGIGSFAALVALQQLLTAGHIRISAKSPSANQEEIVFKVAGNR
ncbi:MAG: DUF4388 domain-containing protein [Acidobacteria bacterium]|nr:DUF4388 domain-containing protein [Acidobacteriota bacterium]